MTYSLGFISDDDIIKHVSDTIAKYRVSLSIGLGDFNSNLIDPIKFTFDAKIYHKSLEQIIEDEIRRQVDKSNTNHIGYFHQNIFKYIGRGWEVPASGYDIINQEQHIYVEMKNKHNTMNSSSAQKIYIQMQDTLLDDPKATCMLVEVIARKSRNTPWKASINGKRTEREQIRCLSIDKFYELVTGDPHAFRKLCEALPTIISDAIDTQHTTEIQNTVFEELQELSPNLTKSIYLLSFKSYEGFANLEIPEI